MTDIKICGLSTPESFDAAIDAGATHVGLVHFDKSPRHVSLEDATKLRRRAPAHVKVVLLLVNADPVATAKAMQDVRPDVIQFHGSETPEWLGALKQKTPFEIWKAFGVRDADQIRNAYKFDQVADRMLFDAPARQLPGGNGTGFDWSIVADHDHHLPWGLAGGLDPANVGQALAATAAPLVDVSSGVESAPGVKDVDLIRAFCEAVQDYDRDHSQA